jgi:FlaA1/EpsC-like NDP-sugar epimerase
MEAAATKAGRRMMTFAGWERTLLLLTSYSVVFLASHFVAFGLRFDLAVPETMREALWLGWLVAVPVKLLCMGLFRQYRVLLGYFSLPDLWRVVGAMSMSSFVLYSLYMVAGGNLDYRALVLPRGVILIDFLVSNLGVVAVRLALRVLREHLRAAEGGGPSRARRVGIIGAGDVGGELAKELLSRRGLGLQPVAFFDDDPKKWRSQLHGVPVVGRPELLRDPGFKVHLDEVIIAMPGAPARRIGEVVRLLQEVRLKFQTVPSVEQLALGKVRVSQLRPVEIQDLLPREPIVLDDAHIAAQLRGRVVMVTGAGGSIGSELCRQILARNPRTLLMVDQSEVQLFPIEQELNRVGYQGQALPLIGDVLDEARMRSLLTRFKPELLFHAAAHKHVPMMESQPGEALKNNTLATARLAHLALEHRVERFLLISTDKAINPTSVMGASKRLAEMYLQALAAAQRDGATRFIAVRFGNVLGSSGSVIPTFTRQIAEGGPVTVTHPEVTRYFMTIPEAVGLVLQATFMGQGGEIFVLDMGRPVKIVDLARQLIELHGLRPDEDIEIRFTGLRPGEKLFEELSHHRENHAPTTHPKVMRFVGEPVPLEQLQAALATLERQLHTLERNQLKLRLKELVPEYEPYLA